MATPESKRPTYTAEAIPSERDVSGLDSQLGVKKARMSALETTSTRFQPTAAKAPASEANHCFWCFWFLNDLAWEV